MGKQAHEVARKIRQGTAQALERHQFHASQIVDQFESDNMPPASQTPYLAQADFDEFITGDVIAPAGISVVVGFQGREVDDVLPGSGFAYLWNDIGEIWEPVNVTTETEFSAHTATIASAVTLGHIRIGSDLEIDGSGVVNVRGLGIVTGKSLTINESLTVNNGAVVLTGPGEFVLGGFTLTAAKTGTATVGTGAANRVTYWSDANEVTSSANLTFNGTLLTLSGATLAISGSATVNIINSNASSSAQVSYVLGGTNTSNNIMSIIGLQYQQTFAPSGGSLGSLFGAVFVPTLNNSVGPTSVIAFLGRVDFGASSSGTTGTAALFVGSAPIVSGGSTATITNFVGLRLSDISFGTNNTYILLGQAASPSGNYSIYSATTSASYLAGALLIGTTTNLAQTTIVPASAATKGAVVRGAASQTANLQEWQDSSGNILAAVTSVGEGIFGKSGDNARRLYVWGSSVRIENTTVDGTVQVSLLNDARNYAIAIVGTSGDGLFFVDNTAGANRLIIPAAGGVVIGGAAIATNATDGFLYIPSCAGIPTGTPTTWTGRIPLVYDTTNNKLYAYNGGWKSVTFA